MAKPPKKRTTLEIDEAEMRQDKPRHSIGGSHETAVRDQIVKEVCDSLWLKYASEDEKLQKAKATMFQLGAFDANCELEGMLAAQMVAAYNASMECFRRAMLPDQTFEGRNQNLNYASKMTRTYALLLDTLNKHRGKGQQKMTVEHVTVNNGGQAIVGSVESRKGALQK